MKNILFSIIFMLITIGCTQNPLNPDYDNQGYIQMWKGKLTATLYNKGIKDDPNITTNSVIVSYVLDPNADISNHYSSSSACSSDDTLACVKAVAFSNVVYEDDSSENKPFDTSVSEWFFLYIDSNSAGEPQFYYESPNTFYYFLTGIPDEGIQYKVYFAVYYDHNDWTKRPIPQYANKLSPPTTIEIKLTADNDKDVPGLVYTIPDYSLWNYND